MKKVLLLGCILLFVVCAPKKTTVETEGLEEVVVFGEEEPITTSTEPVLPVEEPLLPPPPVEEEPMAPAEEEVVLIPPPVAEEPILPERSTPQPYVPPAEPVVPSSAPQTVLGFRVQIFASNTEENASRVATDARGVFADQVYIEYVAPYYKVRVGDYLTREEIEPLKNKALNLGYRGAFIVETMVAP